jgi:hypothetical protein
MAPGAELVELRFRLADVSGSGRLRECGYGRKEQAEQGD